MKRQVASAGTGLDGPQAERFTDSQVAIVRWLLGMTSRLECSAPALSRPKASLMLCCDGRSLGV